MRSSLDAAPRPRRIALRLGFAVATALLVANCASTGKVASKRASTKDYGVPASPKVIPDGEPIPKGGGRAMVGKPYVVGGRTYVPTQSHYKKEGWASWYGEAFHGRLTANGEVFDRESVAAAHPTLPLPSYIRVTNTLNKRSMIVRVNDRGPYEHDRILDVSERVADALDFRRKGTARVRIEYVGKASVRGSDDEKLLASLTTNGNPAPFGRARGDTMLADLREEPALQPSTLAPIRVAEAPIEPATRAEIAAEEQEPVRRPGPVRTVEPNRQPEPKPIRMAALAAAAAAEPDPSAEAPPVPPRRPGDAGGLAPSPTLSRGAATIELLPPQRPILAGIY